MIQIIPVKKVLILYKFLPQYRIEFFEQLKIELAKDNFELELIYGNSPLFGKENLDVHIDWARYIPNFRFKIGSVILLWQPCLKYVKNKDIVIVEGANRLLINYYLMLAKHFSKFKLAFWGHGRNLQEDKGSLRNKFKYLFINKCNWWFVYTKGGKDFLMENKFPENKITVVNNAIDTLSLQKIYDEIKESEINDLEYQFGTKNCKVGIFCGAMYADKKLDFILETCRRVKKEIPEFKMIFIGSGIESYKIEEASKSCDWIFNVGPKFGEERVKYFRISSIQIMPFAVGLGVLDSFAMRTPIVTTFNSYHGPEIEYIENGVNGYITVDNIEDYSRAVIDILKTERYIDLIEGCKSSAKVYTMEAMVANFKNGVMSCLKY